MGKIVLSVRPYQDGDAARIVARPDFVAEHEAAGEPLFKSPPDGWAWTLTRDGVAIGCAGAALDVDGDAHRLWAYLGEMEAREWAFARTATAEKLAFLEGHGGWRFEAVCRADHAGGKRFLQALGFEETRQQRGYIADHCGYRVMARAIISGG